MTKIIPSLKNQLHQARLEIERLNEVLEEKEEASDTEALAARVYEALGIKEEPSLEVLNVLAGELLAAERDGFKNSRLSATIHVLEDSMKLQAKIHELQRRDHD